MRYLLLIYGNEATNMQMTPAEQQVEIGAYNDFGNELQNAGAMVSGEALQPTMTATTVRVRNGKTVTTDGPFAETKEQLAAITWSNAPTSTKRFTGRQRFLARPKVRLKCAQL